MPVWWLVIVFSCYGDCAPTALKVAMASQVECEAAATAAVSQKPVAKDFQRIGVVKAAFCIQGRGDVGQGQ